MCIFRENCVFKFQIVGDNCWRNFKLLEMIFKQCIETGFFPSEWKKANIVPIHKKGDKQTLENYRPGRYYLFVEKSLKD